MSLCGVCYSEIHDGKPSDEDNLGYDGCESWEDSLNSYIHR